MTAGHAGIVLCIIVAIVGAEWLIAILRGRGIMP